MTLDNFNPLEALAGLANKVVDAKLAPRRPAPDVFDSGSEPQYGIDEYGRVHLRGAPTASGSLAGGSAALLVVGAVVVLLLLRR